MEHCPLGGAFPYFFVGTFIEARHAGLFIDCGASFPYFFVGTFLEASDEELDMAGDSEISLLFRRDFH